MNNFLIKLISVSLISGYFFTAENLQALIPYYYLPSPKNLRKDSLSIGKNAYQLLYFGQNKDSLNLAKLAVKIDQKNVQLWSILAETQMANNLYNDALFSLSKAQKLDPKISELYFAKSRIYIKQSKIKKAKLELLAGLKIAPENHIGIFQLGNIFLMEKNYQQAINQFEKALIVKADFWQAINNIGLAYFELDKINLSIISFKKAINLEENAEPLLALASCLKNKNINKAIVLTKKALNIEPKYVDFDYRKEQLWGEKLQISTEKLFENPQIKKEILVAKTKIK